MDGKGLRIVATFGITIVARAKHRALYEAAKKCGTIKQFAEKIGVHWVTVYSWLAMRSAPPLIAKRFWPQARLDKLEKTLFELTGQTLDQLFPSELREREFLSAPKTREFNHDIDLRRLGQYRPDVLALPQPSDVIQREDVSSVIKKALDILTDRQREIVTRRFGLDGRRQETLREIARDLRLTAERVRQLEIRAIRNLKQSQEYGKFFCDAVPDEWTEPARDFESIDRAAESAVSLKERYAEATA